MNFFLGTNEFGSNEWAENFYPVGNEGKSLLKYYSDEFNFIELKSSHYHYDPKQIKKWIGNIENNLFRFCPWISRIFLYQNDPIVQAQGITELLSNWDNCLDKLGPAIFTPSQKYNNARKDKLLLLIENLPKSYSYVLNLINTTWNDNLIIDEIFEHANKNSIGIILKDNTYFSRLNTQFVYIKMDITQSNNIDKLIGDIPSRIKDVYVCLTSADKIALYRRLKEVQSLLVSK